MVAYPVDYRTGGTLWEQDVFAFASEGLRRLDVGTKEWVGLIAYYSRARPARFCPRPRRHDAANVI